MNTDPAAFFREDFTSLFNRGVAELKERAEGGDEKATSRYEDVKNARGVVRLVFEGDGGAEVFLAFQEGEISVVDEPPEGLPMRIALAAPHDAAKNALEEIEGAGLFDSEKAPRRVARVVSAETEAVLDGHTLEFHVTLADLPRDPDEVTLRIGLGVAAAPQDPTFSARVSWDDIEDVRAGEMTPQQLFGRLKLTGDATQAMALGMTLMQKRQGSR